MSKPLALNMHFQNATGIWVPWSPTNVPSINLQQISGSATNTGQPADAYPQASTQSLLTLSFPEIFNGSTYDRWRGVVTPGVNSAATPINANGTATAGTAVATLTGVASQFTWLTALIITMIDTATAGSAELSLSGVQNGPLLFEINAQGTVGVEAPIIIPFPTPIRSSAQNTNIVATLPTLGASTGKVSVVLTGYLL